MKFGLKKNVKKKLQISNEKEAQKMSLKEYLKGTFADLREQEHTSYRN